METSQHLNTFEKQHIGCIATLTAFRDSDSARHQIGTPTVGSLGKHEMLRDYCNPDKGRA